MRKLLVFLTGVLLFMQQGYSQNDTSFIERFDGVGLPVGWVNSPSGSWVSDGTYFIANPSGLVSKSYLGFVPYKTGDTCALETRVYDFSNYQYVMLRFSHICKISPNDIARIEYCQGMGGGVFGPWTILPAYTYKGSSASYKSISAFSAGSYAGDWQASNDNVLPSNDWWKEELFDLENQAGYSGEVKFRFFIQHGSVAGTSAAYGWLIENVELIASTHRLEPPAAAFAAPLVKGTVYNTGPFEISADIKSSSSYPIVQPYLKWTINNGLSYDSVPMTLTLGTSIWKGTIPKIPVGFTVAYSITGKDATGNQTMISSSYTIAFSPMSSYYNNSASVESIDIDETIFTSPTHQTPIKATIKNKGIGSLDSVTVGYAVNGGSPVLKTLKFNPALFWDFDYKDSLGWYTAKVNGYDTIKVWVSDPNGVYDSITWDDTLTKRIYGITDIVAQWVTAPTGTQYSTGLHEVTARIYSQSGAILPALFLYVEKELDNVIEKDTLPLQSSGNNLWTVYLSNIYYETNVRYSIQLRDNVGNDIILLDSFYIEKTCGMIGGTPGTPMDYPYDGSVQSVLLPVGTYEIECWGAQSAHHVASGTAYQGLGSLGGYSKGTLTVNSATTYYLCVGGTPPSTNHYAGGYNGGGSAYSYAGGGGGATHIATVSGQLPTLSSNQSAVVIVAGGAGGGRVTTALGGVGGGVTGGAGMTNGTSIGGTGGTATAGGIDGTPTPASTTSASFGQGASCGAQGGSGGGGGWYGGGLGGYSANSGAGGGSGYIGGVTGGITVQPTDPLYVANPDTLASGNGYARITPIGGGGDDECEFDSNSVAIDAILSPGTSVTASSSIPVIVRIRNVGIKDLDSCYINFSINEQTQLQTDYVYTNAKGLPDGFVDTVLLGSYAQQSKTDKIVVWVSMPNGVVDTITWDDTLKVDVLGCSPALVNNRVTVGIGQDFTTIDEAMQEMQICGVTQDMTLALKGTFQVNLNLSNLSTIMGGYHLTITSSDNHPDSAVIRTTSGVVLTLNNTRNLTLEALTFEGRSTGTHVVQFTGTCTNIVMRNCNLLGNLISMSSTGGEVLYKASGFLVDSFRMVGCLLDGGSYYGAYFYGTSTSAGSFNTNIVWDSNTFQNSYLYAMYPYYNHFTSLSYNTFLSRTANNTSYWYGLRIYYSNADKVVGNRIIQRSPLTYSYPVYIYYAQRCVVPTRTPMLFANNEIVASFNNYTIYGIQDYYSGQYGDIYYLNNSMSIGGTTTGANYGLYITSVDVGSKRVIKNNVISMDGNLNIPIYLGTAFDTAIYDIDYNCFYAPTNVGYAGGPKTSIPLWQATVTTDRNSINTRPVFLDPTLGLNPLGNLKIGGNFTPYLCPADPLVPNDINGTPRSANTTMGCYNSIPPGNLNAALSEIIGLRHTHVAGQTDSLSVEIVNTSRTPITSVNITWSVNGMQYGPTPHNVSLSAMGQSVIIGLGRVLYVPGDMEVKVWINAVNGILDDYRPDDTISSSVFICQSGGLSGVLSIGPNSTFQTLEDAYALIDICGLGGDIVFAFEPGVYNRNLDFKFTQFGIYTATLTSQTGNRDDVIFRFTSSPGILFDGTSNLILKSVTFDARANSIARAVEFQSTSASNDITIDNCKFLGDTTTTSSSYRLIEKENDRGTLHDFTIKNCYIEGGYYGIYMIGHNSSTYAYFVYIDSNVVCKQYYCGIYTYDVHLSSASYNTVTPRSANEGTWWEGMSHNLTQQDGVITNNKIHADNAGISFGIIGLTTDQIGDHLVANNEVYLNSAATYTYGMYINEPVNVDYLHNTILVTGTSANSYALMWDVYNGAYYNATFKNNILVANGGTAPYAIYLDGTYNTPSSYRLDYNNYYSSGNLGYFGGDKANLAAWKASVTQDQNSVSLLPGFANPNMDLELDAPSYNNNTLYCPWETIRVDMNDKIRPNLATMGAYERPPSGYDLMAVKLYPTDDKVVENQVVTLSVDVRNVGANTINNATFGWRVNGGTPQITASIPIGLASYQEGNFVIDAFTITNASNQYDVVVWVESVNGTPDPVNWNDTLSATYTVRTLAEFVQPIVRGTIYQLSFDVLASIYEGSGAPVPNPPKLYTHTILGSNHMYDSIVMVPEKDIWRAKVPPKYYNSKVIYWLPVSDAMGNSIVLMDSVNIEIPFSKSDTVIMGTGTNSGAATSAQYNPYTFTWDYGYTRNHYRAWEIEPNSKGGIISSIAFYNVATVNPSRTDNITFFFKAVTDSICTTGEYIEPLGDGATLVWGPATAVANGAGWVTFDLYAPFYLPPGMNLLVYCDNKNGHFRHNNTATFYFTYQDINTSAYGIGDYENPPGYIFPPGFETKVMDERCNTKLTMRNIDVYQGYDLSLISVLSPINDPNSVCENDAAPVKVLLANFGENDYNFAQNNAVVRYEITEPASTVLTGSITLNTGRLMSGTTDTITLIPSLLMTNGTYNIKAWVESSIDNFALDDTIASSYLFGKVNLPFDEDFSAAAMPLEFITMKPNIGTDNWEVYHPAVGEVVQPDFGTGMLRFTSSAGNEAKLSTRRVDFYGAVSAKLAFWYYHDATTSLSDDSYTGIVVLADGVSTTIGMVYKRDVVSGWQRHVVDITPFINAQCVTVEFHSMNMDRTGINSQYIDRVHIYAEQNLALDAIILPSLAACDYNNKEVQVVLNNTSPLRLDFVQYNTQINVEVYKETTLVKSDAYILNTGYLDGYELDTITLTVTDFDTGTYNLTAWVAVPIDEIPSDDTVRRTLFVSSDIGVEAIAASNAEAFTNCLSMNRPIAQEFRISNNGSLDAYNIPLEAEIRTSAGRIDILQDTLRGVLRTGTTQNFFFTYPYLIPAERTYEIIATATLNCDVNQQDNIDTITECVNMDNIRIIELVVPSGSQPDNVGESIYPEVKIENLSFDKSFTDIAVYAVISANGISDITLTGTKIDTIAAASTIPYKFTDAYPVPAVNNYTIKVFVENADYYAADDTIRANRSTNNATIDRTESGFALGQNIPNPAKDNTRIEYSLPQDGQVIFTVFTITGQVLHIEKREANSGRNELEFNTINLANGIYYYSMEYKGERLVKKMSIHK